MSLSKLQIRQIAEILHYAERIKPKPSGRRSREQVAKMRKAILAGLARGETVQELATKHRVSVHYVHRIRRWRKSVS